MFWSIGDEIKKKTLSRNYLNHLFSKTRSQKQIILMMNKSKYFLKNPMTVSFLTTNTNQDVINKKQLLNCILNTVSRGKYYNGNFKLYFFFLFRKVKICFSAMLIVPSWYTQNPEVLSPPRLKFEQQKQIRIILFFPGIHR